MTMKAGVAEVNITPPVGIVQRGDAGRKGPAQGIHDDLYAQALVLDDGRTKAAIITTDLIGMDRPNTKRIRELVEHQTGIPGRHVLICGSHTHCGPMTSPTLYFQNEKMRRMVDEAWVDVMRRKIAGAVFMAHNGLKEVRIGAGTGMIERGIASPKMVELKDGRTVRWTRELNLDEDDIVGQWPFDPEVGVIKITDDNGTPVAVLVNYTCHAQVAGTPLLISADYPGPMRRMVRQTAGGTPVVMFAQGAAGNIYANRYLRGDWPANGFEEVERIGAILAGEVIKVMERIETDAGSGLLAVQAANVMAPLNELAHTPDDDAMIHFSSAKADDIKGDKVETEVQVFRINDAILVALPGEPLAEIALELKEAILSKYEEIKRVLVIGYTNDSEVGCFPHTGAYDRPHDVTKYVTTVGTLFARGAADVVQQTVIDLVGQIA